jgi:hypothetical protein
MSAGVYHSRAAGGRAAAQLLRGPPAAKGPLKYAAAVGPVPVQMWQP